MKRHKRNTNGQSSQKLLTCRTRVLQRVYALTFVVAERNPRVTRLCFFFLYAPWHFNSIFIRKHSRIFCIFFSIDTDKLLSVFSSAFSFHSQTRISTVFDLSHYKNNYIFQWIRQHFQSWTNDNGGEKA